MSSSDQKQEPVAPMRLLLVGPADEIFALSGASPEMLCGLGIEAQVAWDMAGAARVAPAFRPVGVAITWSCLHRVPQDAILALRHADSTLGIIALVPDEDAGAQSFWAGVDDFLLPSELSWRALRRAVRSAQLQRRFMDDANQQRAMLTMALNVAHAGEWWVDLGQAPDGTITWNDECYLSPALKALLGFSNDEMPNLISAWKERMAPEHRATLRGAVVHHLVSGTPSANIEYRIQHKDGRWLWFLSRGRLLRDGFGRPTRLLGIVMDITSVHEAQEGLAHHSELTTALVRNAPYAVYLLTKDGILLMTNEAGARRFNSDPNSLVGVAMNSLVPPEVARIREEVALRVVSTGSAEILKDSRVGSAETIVFPVPNAHGVIDRFGVILRDEG